MRLIQVRLKLLPTLPAALLVFAAMPAHADTMPQFDFGNPLLLAQVVWGAVIFLAFYAAFTQVGLPRVAGILAAREAAIGADLEQARLAKDKADRAVAELTEARRLAYAEAQAALAGAAQKAKDAAAAKAAEVNARLDAQLAESEQRIAAARAGAQSALREAAADTADMLITRLAGKQASGDVVRAAVGRALAARGLAGA